MKRKKKWKWLCRKIKIWCKYNINNGFYSCINMIFKSLILMVLTMTKYRENLLRDRSTVSLSIVNHFSSLETRMILKIPYETFLWFTQYYYGFFEFHDSTAIMNKKFCFSWPLTDSPASLRCCHSVNHRIHPYKISGDS